MSHQTHSITIIVQLRETIGSTAITTAYWTNILKIPTGSFYMFCFDAKPLEVPLAELGIQLNITQSPLEGSTENSVVAGGTHIAIHYPSYGAKQAIDATRPHAYTVVTFVDSSTSRSVSK